MPGLNRMLTVTPPKVEIPKAAAAPAPSPTPHPAKSFKKSSTIIARVVVPAAQSSARNTSLRIKKIERKCEQCHAPLDMASIVESCQIIDEKLICGRCLKKNAAARKLRVFFRATLAVLILSAVVLAVAAPQAMLLVLLPAGVVFVLAGLLATNFSSVGRLALIALGLGAIAGSFAGTGAISERTQYKQNQASFQKQTEDVHTLIDNNQYVEAQNQLQHLETSRRDRSGQLSPEAAAKIGTLKRQLDDWVRARYGELNTQERSILSGLLSSFPEEKGSDSRRFRSLKFQDNCISIGAKLRSETTDGPSQGPAVDPAASQARGLALLMFSSYPAVTRVEVEVFSNDGESKPLGKFNFDRENATALRMATSIGAPPIPKPASEP